jgi:hypothetical protein
MIDHAGALEAIDRILDRGGDADEVLRAVLAALHERGTSYGVIRFVDGGKLVDGPSIGEPADARTTPVLYQGERVGELEIVDDDAVFAERVATRISPYVLVGWDTAGEPWSP